MAGVGFSVMSGVSTYVSPSYVSRILVMWSSPIILASFLHVQIETYASSGSCIARSLCRSLKVVFDQSMVNIPCVLNFEILNSVLMYCMLPCSDILRAVVSIVHR